MIHEVTIPQVGESINEVYLGAWKKPNGALVTKGEVLIEIETQKTNFELEAPVSGQLQIIIAEEGATVPVLALVAKVDDSKAAEAEAQKGSAPAVKAASAAPVPAQSSGSATPAAAPSAALTTTTPAKAAGTGAHAARNMGRDAASLPKPAKAASTEASQPVVDDPFPYTIKIDEARGDVVKKATRIRTYIADNLKKAQKTAAILTTFNEIDMSAVIAARSQHKAAFQQKYGYSLGFVGFFALASAKAMTEYPMVNALFMGDQILERPYVDISVAVSTEKGLVVPVIRNVQGMNLADFEGALSQVAEKARGGKLTIPDMEGGTFSITNGGVFGSLMSTPILNMPQSAILGLHATKQRAVVLEDGTIAARPMMYVALSYDHRIIDGKEAVQFLVSVKNSIEKIETLVDFKKLLG
jgi:2-oxoglutarate dehydrogenase E2 component (dihydrolipoamide succinyltransferase)